MAVATQMKLNRFGALFHICTGKKSLVLLLCRGGKAEVLIDCGGDRPHSLVVVLGAGAGVTEDDHRQLVHGVAEAHGGL